MNVARSHRPKVTFDAAKVKALEDALLNTLAEAKNIRHLKDAESIIVTVAGTDTAGQPVRLTLKAAKTDLARLASGKLQPGEFRKKVSINID